MSGIGAELSAIDAQFEALLELDEAARTARLSELETSAPALAETLRRLLALSGRADTEQLRKALEAEPEPDTPTPEVPGYTVLSELGRGGMATVYEAERSVHGARSRVAIKLLRPRFDDPLVGERFLREQRILSTLRHPNIAVLLDYGTVGGRPYAVMERIDGAAIDRRLLPGCAPVATVVQMLERVADAVQCAHEHLVVHRDIKPQNVLVDADGTPKLIDFGVAKVLEQPLESDRTQTGSAPMTLRWASPEQLRAEPVGVASDIYQLGLLTYWLLTGAWPFEEQEAQIPLLRTQRESAPIRPSERAPDRVRARRLRGDLDAIVLRCLAFRPEDRYRTARELQLDLRCYLAAQPVSARRHTTRYLARAFVRRNRWAVGLGATLLIYAATLSWQALALVEQRDSAELARARAESTQRFLLGVIGSADPQDHVNRGRDLDDMLRDGAERAREDFASQPVLAAQVLDDLGVIMHRRSRLEDAAAALREAADLRIAHLGADHVDTLASRFSLAAVLHDLSRPAETRAALDELLPAIEARLGADSLELAEALMQLSYAQSVAAEHDDSERGLLRSRAIMQALPIDHPPSVLSKRSLAELRADVVVYLGNSLIRAKRREEAEPLINEAYELRRAMWGDADPRTLEARQNRAFLLRQLRRFDEARAEFEAVLVAQRALYGGPHLLSAYTLGHLANLHSDQGDYDGAVRGWQQSEDEARAALGEAHPWIATTQWARARSLQLGGRKAEARAILQRLATLTEREDGLAARAAAQLAEIDAVPRVP